MLGFLTLTPYTPESIKNAADKFFHKDELQLFHAKDRQSFFSTLEKENIELVLISNDDISDESMIDIVQNVRMLYEDLVIIVITRSEDRALAMKLYLLGIDEWVKKPVDAMEMALRCRAMLRKAGIRKDENVRVGSLSVDLESRTVKAGGQEVHLPRKEFMLLHLLLSHPGKIYSKAELMEQIWGYDSDSSDATVAVHVDRIRKRFRGSNDFEIVSVRGVGYKAVIKE